jgi:hypothetical protein
MLVRYAAPAIDAWLRLVRLLRRPRRAFRAAWSSLPGDALGWLAMRACGIDAPSRVVEQDGVRVFVVEDPRTARLLDNQHAAIHAQTLGRYIFCRERLSDHILAHELEHVRHWRRFGPIYEPLYFGSAGLALLRGRRPAQANWFEAAAWRRADAEEAARRNQAHC